jgi:hypothetical protein
MTTSTLRRRGPQIAHFHLCIVSPAFLYADSLDDQSRQSAFYTGSGPPLHTPRKSTPRGRVKVVDWLKMIENGTTASADCNNEITNYSFDWLWAELGVVDRGGDDPPVPGTRAHDRTIQSLLVSYHEDGAEYFGRHRSLLDRGEGAPYQTN